MAIPVLVSLKISFLNFKFVFLKKQTIVATTHRKIAGWCFMREIRVIELIHRIAGCHNAMLKGRSREMAFSGGDFYHLFDIPRVFLWSIWR